MTNEHMPSEDRLREVLVGRRITSARIDGKYTGKGVLSLDDGTVLNLWGHEGGCSCGAGDYPLAVLNDCPDNVITNVEIVESPGGDYDVGDGYYRIFIYASVRQLMASFEGSDGSGYYGTGWWLSVQTPTKVEN